LLSLTSVARSESFGLAPFTLVINCSAFHPERHRLEALFA